MAFLALIIKSAFRNRLRASLTALGVAIATIAFLFLRTFIAAWYAGVDAASADRLVARNKISITFSLPLSYVDKVRSVPGVADVAYENWVGGYYKDEREFFANFAADDRVFDLYPEVLIDPEARKAYDQDRQGCIVGPGLAEKYQWKIGDRITLKGTIYPVDFELNVRGIYRAGKKNVDNGTLFFHWKYFNENVPDRVRDRIGFLILKVADPLRSAQVASAVDHMFENSLAETQTESEKAFQLSFISMSSAVIAAIQVVSGVILLILMLILANTMAMATRERTGEYAVMRAIGFQPAHVVRLVLGEGFVIAFVGVLLGVGLATPILGFFAKIFAEYLGAFLGDFGLEWRAVVLAVAVALVLGMLAAALPAWRAGRLRVADGLRRIE